MLIGGVKDVLLEQGQTGGDTGSKGGRRRRLQHRDDTMKTKSTDRLSTLRWPGGL